MNEDSARRVIQTGCRWVGRNRLLTVIIVVVFFALVVGLSSLGGTSTGSSSSSGGSSSGSTTNPNGYVGAPNDVAPTPQPYHDSVTSTATMLTESNGQQVVMYAGTDVEMNCWIGGSNGPMYFNVTVPSAGVTGVVLASDIGNQWLSSPQC